ncbi:hypothetical protein N8482_02790, partial [Chitinophagales bacterium]|nr:hypothetical protein [Chitinophagales bacterium]
GQIKLSDEIKFLTDYLGLEQLRFGNRFDFSFDIDEEVEEDFIEIPSMLLQPYIENAIIHGMRGLERKGEIVVGFRFDNDNDNKLICTVDDNGVGRQSVKRKKENTSSHKSLGMQITKDRLSSINKEESSSVEIIDKLNDKGEPMGTTVIFSIAV